MNPALRIQWWRWQTSPLFLRRFHSCGRGQMISKWTETVSLWELSHQPSLPSWHSRRSGEPGVLTALERARLSPALRPLPMLLSLAGKLCTQTSHGFFLLLVQVSAEMSPPKEAALICACKIGLPHSTWFSVLFSSYLLHVETVLFMCMLFVWLLFSVSPTRM